MTTTPAVLDLPAADGRPVTEAHVKLCRELGHLRWTRDDRDRGICPRCGAVTVPAEQVAAIDLLGRARELADADRVDWHSPDVDRRRYIEAAQLDRTMRAQIANARPCSDCGDYGHAAVDHDDEPTPASVELERVLRESLSTPTPAQCEETHNPGVWPCALIRAGFLMTPAPEGSAS